MKNTLSAERKTGKVFLSLIVAVFAMMLMLTVSLTSSAENIANGTCGDNLTWVLDDEGTLTIDGEGDMDNFSSYSTPWISYRDKIMNVIIGNDVTSIGGQAFENCYGLSSISIGSSVKSIGFRAFYTCSSLKELVMPNSVTDIGDSMCYCCGNLENVVLSEKLTSISELAFYECYKLNNVVIPKGVTSIKKNAFHYCTNFTSMEIPDSVISIEDKAFLGCENLSNIKIGKGVADIGSQAFSSCTSLSSIIIPGNVKVIGSSAFWNCTNLTDLTISEGILTIEKNAFNFCTALKYIFIPNSVTSIGDTSFQWCKSVTNITIGKGLSNIGNQAFYGCGNILTNIVVDEENKTFDSRDNCNAIIETESNTLLIGSNSTTIPKSVTTIADNAFYDCNIVTNVVIPNNITDIGISAFQSCDNLSEVTLPESLESISNNLFYLCGKLSGISIPDNVTSIGKNSFAYTALKSISISANVTFIGTYAFGACKNLTEVTIDKENRVYDNRENCNAIIETESNTIIAGFNNTIIPYSVTRIGDYAFCNYNFIEIPNSIISIGNYAYGFDGMRDLHIIIPDSVTSIDNDAFRGMTHDYSRIYGYEGSAAQSYANERNIPFVILDKGCQHSETKNVGAYEASCRLNGYTGNLCCVSCGKIIQKGEIIKKHSFTNYISDNNATCFEDGTKTARCDYCAETDTIVDKGSKISHDFTGKAVSNLNGTHSFECKNGCGLFGNEQRCQYTITDDPDTGKNIYTCSVCGYSISLFEGENEVSTWAELKRVLEFGATAVLTADITPDDSRITVHGKAELDLNGHNINYQRADENVGESFENRATSIDDWIVNKSEELIIDYTLFTVPEDGEFTISGDGDITFICNATTVGNNTRDWLSEARIVTVDGGVLNLLGGNLRTQAVQDAYDGYSHSSSAVAATIVNKNGTVNIDGGSVYADAYAQCFLYSHLLSATSRAICGYSDAIAVGIYSPTGKVNLISGDITVNGETSAAYSTKFISKFGKNYASFMGYSVGIDLGENGSLEMSGGTINATEKFDNDECRESDYQSAYKGKHCSVCEGVNYCAANYPVITGGIITALPNKEAETYFADYEDYVYFYETAVGRSVITMEKEQTFSLEEPATFNFAQNTYVADADGNYTRIDCGKVNSIVPGCYLYSGKVPSFESNHNKTHDIIYTVNGETVRKAETCSFIKTVVKPTVVNQGYTVYTCAVCGYSYISDYVDPITENFVTTAEGTDTYILFNSGNASSVGQMNGSYSKCKNPAWDSLTNGGYDIYGRMRYPGQCDDRIRIGQAVYVTGEVTENVVLSVNAYDVDEESGEYDVVYLMDDTDGTETELGFLSGMNNRWNNTNLEISPDKFQKDHIYHFEVKINDKRGGCTWWVFVRNVSLQLTITEFDGGNTVKANSFGASIAADGTVSTNLVLTSKTAADYYIEYEAVSFGYQFAALDATVSVATSKTAFNHSFKLPADAPLGVYEITAYIKDADENVLKTISTTAGYTRFAVSYDTNGGSNSVPVDTNPYSTGDTVNVLFGVTPTMKGYKFMGWSTDASAATAEFTYAGKRTFVIEDSDVTLYAVYQKINCVNHKFDSVVTKSATCTQDGQMRLVCSVCGYETTQTIHAQHSYEQIDYKAATCDTAGYINYRCAKCGDTYTETITVSHMFTSEITVRPTKTTPGTIKYTCTLCGYSYTESIYGDGAHVLLIQDSVPWLLNDNAGFLNRCVNDGYIAGWDITTTDNFKNVDLNAYQIILIANDQTTAAYNKMASLNNAICEFAQNGGAVVYGACDNGWKNGNISYSLPGGVVKNNYYSGSNYIVDYSSPIVTGELTDNKPLTNSILKGTYCSHSWFSALPENANVITEDANGNPTLVEYPYGNGRIIVSGLTWEFYYTRTYAGIDPNFSKNVYDDLLMYAFSRTWYAAGCNHEKETECVEATCTQDGFIREYCKHCNIEFSYEIIPAKGHCTTDGYIVTKKATCEQDGVKSLQCSVCGTKLLEDIVIPASGHEFGDWEYSATVSCTTGGQKTHYCLHTVESDEYEVCDYSETTDTEALGHLPGEAVIQNMTSAACTSGGSYDSVVYCERCSEELSRTKVTIQETGHKEGEAVIENQVEPTCEEDGGYDTVVRCTVCGEIISSTHTTVDAIGHNWREVERVNASCTSDGYVVYECDNGTAHTKREILQKYEHTPTKPVKENMIPATCEKEGSYELCYYCAECHGCYSRENVTIAPLGHDYGEFVFDGKDVKTHTAVCANDPNCKKTEGCNFTQDITPATCEQDGKIVYTCSVCGGTYEEIITARGHSFGEWYTVTESDCETAGLERRDCQNAADDKYEACSKYETREIPITDHTPGTPVTENEVEATCEEKGGFDTVIYCTECEKELSRQHTDIAAKGHIPGEMTVVSKASCTAGGLKEQHCTECTALLDSEVIPAKGHNFGEWTDTKTATCVAGGEQKRTCANTGSDLYEACDCVETRETEIDPNNHALVHHDAREATCEENGWKAYDTCSREGCTYSTYEDDIATGHTPTIVNAKKATDKISGYTGDKVCSGCGKVLKTGALIPAGSTLLPEDYPDLESGEFVHRNNGKNWDFWYENQTFVNGTEFVVADVTDGDDYDYCSSKNKNGKFKLFDLKAQCGEMMVQPNGDIWIALNIPGNFDPNNTVICYVNSATGQYEKMPCFVKDGKIYFRTNHFSSYAVVEQGCAHSYASQTKPATCTTDGAITFTCTKCSYSYTEVIKATGHIDINDDGICDKCSANLRPVDPSATCTHMCHQTGFMGFLWKIICFFCKLFGTNQVCSCGAAHY